MSLILVLVVQVTTRIRLRRIFFLPVAQRKKRRNLSTDELPTRFAVDFLSYESLKTRKRRIFFTDELHTRAGSTRSQGSRGVRQGWSVAEMKRKEKDQGRWSVATRRGRKKRKEKDQGRQEGGSAKARFRVSSTKNFFFLVPEYLGSERPVSFEVSAPTRLSLRGSHVQRKFQKRTTLRSKSSTLIGLLYTGWRSRCKYSKECRTIALEHSVSKKAVFWQATINLYSRVGDPLVISCLGCTA